MNQLSKVVAVRKNEDGKLLDDDAPQIVEEDGADSQGEEMNLESSEEEGDEEDLEDVGTEMSYISLDELNEQQQLSMSNEYMDDDDDEDEDEEEGDEE